MNIKAPFNILNGNHVLGALVGAAVSAPATTWLFYWLGSVFSVHAIIDMPLPVFVTLISAFMVVYFAIASLVAWLLGGMSELF